MVNPHFAALDGWGDAEELIGYRPRVPTETLGHALQSLSVFVLDHELREVPPGKRSLEASYGAFSFSQSRPGAREARRLALETSYGRDAQEARIAGREGRRYERGPEPAPDDPDGRMPAVVAWCDGAAFYFLASDQHTPDELALVGSSLYR